MEGTPKAVDKGQSPEALQKQGAVILEMLKERKSRLNNERFGSSVGAALMVVRLGQEKVISDYLKATGVKLQIGGIDIEGGLYDRQEDFADGFQSNGFRDTHHYGRPRLSDKEIGEESERIASLRVNLLPNRDRDYLAKLTPKELVEQVRGQIREIENEQRREINLKNRSRERTLRENMRDPDFRRDKELRDQFLKPMRESGRRGEKRRDNSLKRHIPTVVKTTVGLVGAAAIVGGVAVVEDLTSGDQKPQERPPVTETAPTIEERYNGITELPQHTERVVSPEEKIYLQIMNEIIKDGKANGFYFVGDQYYDYNWGKIPYSRGIPPPYSGNHLFFMPEIGVDGVGRMVFIGEKEEGGVLNLTLSGEDARKLSDHMQQQIKFANDPSNKEKYNLRDNFFPRLSEEHGTVGWSSGRERVIVYWDKNIGKHGKQVQLTALAQSSASPDDVTRVLERSRKNLVPDYTGKDDDTTRITNNIGNLLDKASKVIQTPSSSPNK